MPIKPNLLTEQVRQAIRERTRQSRSKGELVETLFDSLRRLQIEPRELSLHEMKLAVAVAVHAVRESSGESPSYLLA